MNYQKYLVPLIGIAAIAGSYYYKGWGGVALVVGALLMYLLLNFNRMMKVLSRAAERPVGYVDSAVMLNARLRPGFSLMHVIAMTRSLGQAQSPENQQPEFWRWTDNSDSHVTGEFRDGKLVRWELFRPAQPDEPADAPAALPLPPPPAP